MPNPSHRRILLSIICVVSIYGLTIGFLHPLISLQMEARGFPPSWIGIMGATPFFSAVIASPVIPLIMRTVNLSRLVFLSICVDLILILVMMFIDNVFVWFISRFLMGAAGSVLFVVSETWINEIAEDRSRGQVLGLYTLTLSSSFALAPLFIVLFGAEGSLPFLAAFIVIAFSLIPLRWTRGTSPDFSGGHVSHVWQFMLWAPTLVCAAISRFLMGAAGSVLFVVSETWINEIAEDRSRGQVLGLYTLTLSSSFALAPLFIVLFGAEGSLPFLAAFIVIAFSLIPLRWTRGTSPDFSGGHVSHVWQFMLWAPTLVCAAALMAFEEAALITLLPVYSLQNGVTEKVAALYLTVLAVGSMAAQPLIGWLADKVNRYTLIFACALVVLLGALSLPFIIDTHIIVWPVMLVWGGAIAGIYTVALAIMGQRFRGAQLAAGNAAFGVMWGVAGTLAPGSAGFAMTTWGANGFVIVMVIAVSSFLLLLLIRRIVSSN